jgi:hypothetical protein
MEIAHFADLSKGERKRLDLDKAGRELGNIEDVRNDSLKVVTYNAQRISINSSGSDRARRKRERERRDEPERMIWEMCSWDAGDILSVDDSSTAARPRMAKSGDLSSCD